jgi:hypothetical protein
MGIVNIVDGRNHRSRFNVINAVAEAAWHDNSVKATAGGVDQIDAAGGPDYDERERISLAEAISWASGFAEPVTLGEIPPGTALSEAEIARRFSISRQPVRRKLRGPHKKTRRCPNLHGRCRACSGGSDARHICRSAETIRLSRVLMTENDVQRFREETLGCWAVRGSNSRPHQMKEATN